jgi:hypothetical protein
MSNDTHTTAPTRYVEADGLRYAYRRFGSQSGTPLVFLQHFRGGLDNWDPLVTDGLAQGRPVILFNNAGVASSSGETPDTVDAMGDHLAAFVDALGLTEIDLHGAHDQRVHAFAAHSECATDRLSGLRSWRALPVSRALRGAHEALPGRLS